MGELLKKIKWEALGKTGFPELTAGKSEALMAFLQRFKLEEKSAQELHDMAGQSEQLLRHLGLDLPLFRHEVVARRDFLFGIMSFSADPRALETGSPALDYLSAHDESARKLAERLAELEKTKGADEREWHSAEKIKQKKEELSGTDRAALEKTMRELRALADVLDGKAEPAKALETEKGSGIVGAIMKLLGGK
jgi:hypothetical protein